MQFDPLVIGFERMLEIFWTGIEPTHPPSSRQYANIIFFHDDGQKRQAEESRQRLETRLKKKAAVEILPYKRLYPAEDYHQKYYMQQSRELMQEMGKVYPKLAGLLNSTAAARLNAYRGGNLSADKLRAALTKIDALKPSLDRILLLADRAGVMDAH